MMMIQDLVVQINKISKEVEKKEQQIEELSKEIENLKRGFSITEKEWEAIDNWKKEHLKKAHHGNISTNTHFKYEFIPTSVGTIGNIICTECGESFTFHKLGEK